MTSVSSTGGADAVSAYAALRDRLFAKADTDGSGGLSLAEFQQVAAKGPNDGANAATVFSQIDKDGDGQISPAEMAAFKPPQSGGGGHHHHSRISSDTSQALLNILSQGDTDSNGTLSLDEFKAVGATNSGSAPDAAALFGQIDTNSDGQITAKELTVAVDSSTSSTDTVTDVGSGTCAAPAASATPASTSSDQLAKMIEQYLANYLSGAASTTQGSLYGQLA